MLNKKNHDKVLNMPTHLSGLLQSSLIFQMNIESENHSKQQHANSVFQVSLA
jgi:hypothetical protein